MAQLVTGRAGWSPSSQLPCSVSSFYNIPLKEAVEKLSFLWITYKFPVSKCFSFELIFLIEPSIFYVLTAKYQTKLVATFFVSSLPLLFIVVWALQCRCQKILLFFFFLNRRKSSKTKHCCLLKWNKDAVLNNMWNIKFIYKTSRRKD